METAYFIDKISQKDFPTGSVLDRMIDQAYNKFLAQSSSDPVLFDLCEYANRIFKQKKQNPYGNIWEYVYKVLERLGENPSACFEILTDGLAPSEPNYRGWYNAMEGEWL